MKKIFFVSLIVAVCLSSARGQSKEVVVAYFNKDWKQVSDSTSEVYYYRTVEQKDTRFLVREYTISHSLWLKAECSAFEPDVIFNGHVTFYHGNGKIAEEGTYKNGSRTGVFQCFYNTGKLKGELEYEAGKTRYLQSFSETGESLLTGGNGSYSELTKYGTEHIEIENYKSISRFVIDNSNDTIYTEYDTPAKYRGGDSRMMADIAKTMRYPAESRRHGVQGTVFISFILTKTGAVENITVLKGISEDCDAEAVRVVSLMNRWIPARHKGKVVKSKYVIPIRYRLG